MKIREGTTRFYICDKCGAKYREEEFAKLCRSLPVPDPKFKIGDRVSVSVFQDSPISVQVKHVTGPYPPHPHARRTRLLLFAKKQRTFFFKDDRYLKMGFRQNVHIYFYAVTGIRKDDDLSWFFEEELFEEEGQR